MWAYGENYFSVNLGALQKYLPYYIIDFPTKQTIRVKPPRQIKSPDNRQTPLFSKTAKQENFQQNINPLQNY